MFWQSGLCLLNVDSRHGHRSGRNQPIRVVESLRDLPVAARANRLAELNRQLQQLLPAALGERSVLADVQSGHAVFLAPTSAWAAKLRLSQGQLRQHLLALGEQVQSITVKVVQPERVPPAQTAHKPLTAATAEHLRSVAASVTDPELKARFLALASLAEPAS